MARRALLTSPKKNGFRVAYGYPAGVNVGTRLYSTISFSVVLQYGDTWELMGRDGVGRRLQILAKTSFAQLVDWVKSAIPSNVRILSTTGAFFDNTSGNETFVDPVLDLAFLIELPADFDATLGPLIRAAGPNGQFAQEGWGDLGFLSVFGETATSKAGLTVAYDPNTRGARGLSSLPALPVTRLARDPVVQDFTGMQNATAVEQTIPDGTWRDVVDPIRFGESAWCDVISNQARSQGTLSVDSWLEDSSGDEYTVVGLVVPFIYGDEIVISYPDDDASAVRASLTDLIGVVDACLEVAAKHYGTVHSVLTQPFNKPTFSGLFVHMVVKVPEQRPPVPGDIPSWRYDWRMQVSAGGQGRLMSGFASPRIIKGLRYWPAGAEYATRWARSYQQVEEPAHDVYSACDPATRVRYAKPPTVFSLTGSFGGVLPARGTSSTISLVASTSPTKTQGAEEGMGILNGILKFFKSLFKAIFNFIKRNWLLIAVFAVAVAVFFPAVLPAIWGALTSGWATIAGAISSAGSAYMSLFNGLSFWEGAALLAGTAFIVAPEETSKAITRAGSTMGTALGLTVGGALGAAASSSGLSSVLFLGAGLLGLYFFTGRKRGDENESQSAYVTGAQR